jgi:hypothetical protein
VGFVQLRNCSSNPKTPEKSIVASMMINALEVSFQID